MNCDSETCVNDMIIISIFQILNNIINHNNENYVNLLISSNNNNNYNFVNLSLNFLHRNDVIFDIKKEVLYLLL